MIRNPKYKHIGVEEYRLLQENLGYIESYLEKKQLKDVKNNIIQAFQDGLTLDEILDRVKIELKKVDDILRSATKEIKECYFYTYWLLYRKRIKGDSRIYGKSRILLSALYWVVGFLILKILWSLSNG